ncbi:hypothetical protein KXD40_002606 [Peronospora effusa]|uniref:Uncharacterized protein n=1 Tax=Peronospora effusa TaxID=542832 RepID=A0A3M6VK74_9STRA|nr:hypothetical protein DD238_003207 [Peronospora effusa]RQM09221.1 hypothetical protein DD237_000313 [Peronospora effusa]UIZ26572.1 hypothetical protein KXD40_002606 [Peronospora effusa]
MQTPSSSLHVISSRFFRLECNHEYLFQSEYKRSNRTKGLKILRCFPHCCPEHIDRSYCGSSLSVEIQLAECPSESVPSKPAFREILSVFARFEAVSDGSLCPGECVDVNIMEQEVQTETHLDGQWIAGVLVRPLEVMATNHEPVKTDNDDNDATASLEEPNSLVYNLNGKAFSKWYYDWESGANKAQRLMKHVLKAYIVERIAVDRDNQVPIISNQETLMQVYRVVHVVSSPEFTVISYRRAPMDQLQLAHAHAAVQLGKTQSPLQVTSSLLEGVSPNGLRTFTNEIHHWGVYKSVHNANVAREDDVAVWSSKLNSSLQSEFYEAEAKRRRRMYSNEQELVHPLEDKLCWEHLNAPAVAVSKSMALLLAFVRWAPLRLYVPVAAELVHLLDQRIFELVPASAQKTTKPNCFSRLLLQYAQIEESIRATGEGATLRTLLRVASQTVLWLYSQETCHWIRQFFRQNATSVLDKMAMRSCFLHFLRELEERLSAEVLAATALRRLSNVAEEVIAAVYSCELFYDRRPLVRQILSGQSFAGWNMFVAQMRDTYIGATSLPVSLPPLCRNVTFLAAFPPRNVVERSWNGEWCLDMDDVQWDVNEIRSFGNGGKSSADPRVPDVSLFSLVKLISQIVRFEVAIDIRESSLRVCASQGLAGCVDCMHLVLDGKDRVYRTCPNGITSCGGDGTCGDYVGEMCFEDTGQLAIFLEIYNWSLEQGTRSYHVRAKIECHNSGRLAVDGDILETTGSSTFPSDKLSYVGEMSLRAKLESIKMASARRYDGTGASRDIPAASWAEYGKFHLGYRKMCER